MDVARKAMTMGAQVLNPGAVSLFGGLVASGHFDGIIFPGKDYWEAIAIGHLVHNAGGRVTNANGFDILYNPEQEMNGMVASNGHLHHQLLGLLK